MNIQVTVLTIIAYLIGSIPTGIVVAKILGAPDPRTIGSGNIGATNVGRAAGKAAGIVTLIGDILKGFLIILFALYIFGNSPREISIIVVLKHADNIKRLIQRAENKIGSKKTN